MLSTILGNWDVAIEKSIEKTFWSGADVPPRLFKSLEFGNGSRMPDEKLVILKFKYLQNKKW